jgi:aldehyde dehydrogenase (NAD+)
VLGTTVAGAPPLLAAVQRVARALACGNSVVLGPDADAPLTALVLAEAATEAGLPAGVLNVLPGATVFGPVDGMVPALGPRPERGVHIVHDDAPFDQAVDGIVETLGTDRRVLVAESVADELGELLRGRMARLRVGDPLDRNSDVGPVSSRARHERAAALLGDLVVAQRFTSPAPLPDHGLYLAPTLLTDVAPATPPARDEITGPLVPVLTFRTPAEAVTLAGAVRTAAVWTDKGSRALWTAQRLRAEVVWIDAVDRWDPALPASGLRDYLRT